MQADQQHRTLLYRIRPGGPAWLLALLLTACATTPPPPGATDPLAASAERIQQQGSWAEAARLWEQAAAEAPAGQVDPYRLYAADAWWRAGDKRRSEQLLGQVRESGLDRNGVARLALLRGEMAIASGDALQAEFFLETAESGLAADQRSRLREARDALTALRSDPGAQALASASALLRSMPRPEATGGLAVLQQLEKAPSSRVRDNVSDFSRIGQWSALSLDLREAVMSDTDLQAAAERWRRAHPRSEIDAALYLELAWQYRQRFLPPRRTAVLLPGAGNLHAAATAIRDGLVAAVVSRPAGAEIDIIPVPETPDGVLEIYREVAIKGYDWVIGPLDRAAVERVAGETGAPPTLLLNRRPAATEWSPDDYSLALDQSEEAQAVARLMLETGSRRVLLLIADNAWGARTEAAFTEALVRGEGVVVASEVFNTSEADHSERLTELLKIADSRARKDRLQSALGIQLDFEATRRDDFDAIFMAADPVLGRQLKPQLRFFDAGDKPVYAMNRVFSGRVSSNADTDLDGVVFAATRWALEEPGVSASLASVRGGAFGTLNALGHDAWNLLAFLPLLAADSELAFPGKTGMLTLDEFGNLHRQPYWAQFSRGRPVEWAPRELP